MKNKHTYKQTKICTFDENNSLLLHLKPTIAVTYLSPLPPSTHGRAVVRPLLLLLFIGSHAELHNTKNRKIKEVTRQASSWMWCNTQPYDFERNYCSLEFGFSFSKRNNSARSRQGAHIVGVDSHQALTRF